MKIEAEIIFHMDPDEAEKMLNPIGLIGNKKYRMQVIRIYTDTEKYRRLKEELIKRGIEFKEWHTEVYSEEEIAASELLHVIPVKYCGYPQPELDWNYENIVYGPGAGCPKCGQGKIQKHPFQMHKPQMGKNDIAGIWWEEEFVVTQKLRDLIEKEGLTGCEFWPIISHRQKVPFEGVYQLFITSVMPPMSKEAQIVRAKDVKACECGKKGYTLKGLAVYDRSSLKDIKDFNKTHEWLGGGESTWQFPIVTKRVYELFKREKIRGVRFEPVKIVD